MKKKVLLPVIIILLICGIPVFLAWLNFPSFRYSHIAGKNDKARQVRDFVAFSLDYLDLLSEGVYLLSGECDKEYFLIYADDLILKDAFVYEIKHGFKHAYWTARIDNGEVQEAWLGDKLIPESDLHKYTISDQQEHVYFVNPLIHPIKWWKSGWADDSGILGYYQKSDS